MPQVDDPFLQALQGYSAAVRAKDGDAFLQLYDTHLHAFDLWGPWSQNGLDGWRRMVTGWFSSIGEETVVVTFDQADSYRVDDLAIGHALLTYTATASDGSVLRSLSNRITMALRKRGNGWKIVHEHTSAPVDHGTLKAVLKRTE